MPSRILYWAKAKLVKGESKGKNGGNEILSLNYAEPHPIVCVIKIFIIGNKYIDSILRISGRSHIYKY